MRKKCCLAVIGMTLFYSQHDFSPTVKEKKMNVALCWGKAWLIWTKVGQWILVSSGSGTKKMKVKKMAPSGDNRILHLLFVNMWSL